MIGYYNEIMVRSWLAPGYPDFKWPRYLGTPILRFKKIR